MIPTFPLSSSYDVVHATIILAIYQKKPRGDTSGNSTFDRTTARRETMATGLPPLWTVWGKESREEAGSYVFILVFMIG